jgi:N-methylhydantoinase B
VAREVREGLVSAEGARRYGVVVTTDGEVDAAATETLRAEMRASRPEPAAFDFGPPLDERRARCLDETGLPAPRAPVALGAVGNL